MLKAKRVAPILECVCCTKHIHEECYKEVVLGKRNITYSEADKEKLVDKEDGSEHHPYVCGVRCYDKLVRERKASKKASTKPPRVIGWTKDAPPGSEVTSTSVLMDWLTTHGNYDRYRGDTVKGKTKLSICAEIAEKIRKAGCLQARTQDMVFKKVTAMENSYKSAIDWFGLTGVGVSDVDGVQVTPHSGPEKHKQSTTEILLKRCPYFYELDPIFRDRPNYEALALGGSLTQEPYESSVAAEEDQSEGGEDTTNSTYGQSVTDDIEDAEEESVTDESVTKATTAGSLPTNKNPPPISNNTNAADKNALKTPRKSNVGGDKRPRVLNSGKRRVTKVPKNGDEMAEASSEKVLEFRRKELRQKKKHQKRELRLQGLVTKATRKKLNAETQKIRLEAFTRRGNAVVEHARHMKELIDLGMSREDAEQELGNVPSAHEEEEKDEDITELLESDSDSASD